MLGRFRRQLHIYMLQLYLYFVVSYIWYVCTIQLALPQEQSNTQMTQTHISFKLFFTYLFFNKFKNYSMELVSVLVFKTQIKKLIWNFKITLPMYFPEKGYYLLCNVLAAFLNTC